MHALHCLTLELFSFFLSKIVPDMLSLPCLTATLSPSSPANCQAPCAAFAKASGPGAVSGEGARGSAGGYASAQVRGRTVERRELKGNVNFPLPSITSLPAGSTQLPRYQHLVCTPCLAAFSYRSCFPKPPLQICIF